MKIIEPAEMKDFTSFKVGGKAEKLVICDCEEDLATVLNILAVEKRAFILIGNGSNTLFTDEGYRGTVVKLGDFFAQMKCEGNKIIAGASALMSKVSGFAIENRLSGFEFASGIPGSLGGAIFMNAGAYGGQMEDIVESVRVISKDGESFRTIYKDELDFGYRHSVIQDTGEVAVEITLGLEKGKREEIEERVAELTEKRNSKQPLAYPSCGSFFKRPEGYFAGKLIEDAGLRGVSVGGAQVSEKHCGFLINKGDATAKDVLALKKLVQDTVYEKFGVRLEPEVRIIGE